MEHLPNRSHHDERVTVPQLGDHVMLRKLAIDEGKYSEVPTGSLQKGMLLEGIEVGNQILLDSGTETSLIQSIETRNDTLVVRTQTSVYEVSKMWAGMNFRSDIGSVSLPADARIAHLMPGIAPEFPVEAGEEVPESLRIRIDRNALSGILIETAGAVVHQFDKRYLVLAKVGSAHVPFYRSSSGTGGKSSGEWYPFFGYTGEWLIKGSIDEQGGMHYHPKLSEVQRILNDRLILPDPLYVNKEHNITWNDGSIAYALGEQIPMTDVVNEIKKGVEMSDEVAAFIARRTGYEPTELSGYNPEDRDQVRTKKSHEWIESVISRIP